MERPYILVEWLFCSWVLLGNSFDKQPDYGGNSAPANDRESKAQNRANACRRLNLQISKLHSYFTCTRLELLAITESSENK